jgi:hypothetical protein
MSLGQLGNERGRGGELHRIPGQQIAELIDDQELGFGEMSQPLLEPTFASRPTMALRFTAKVNAWNAVK